MVRRLAFFLLLTVLCALSCASLAYSQKEQLPQGTPVLWRDPADVSRLDLFWGPGGPEQKPDLRKVTLIKKETGGYSTKYRVRDASGREWVAKIGKEAHSETVANRLMWAVGFFADKTSLVPRIN